MYINILCHLGAAVRMKCPQKWRTTSWFPLPGNSPAYWLVLVKDILTKNDVTTLEHTPYSPDLAPADFCLFPQLKSVLKGEHFCVATDIIKNATAFTNWLPGTFPTPLQLLAEVYSCTMGLFEGNIA